MVSLRIVLWISHVKLWISLWITHIPEIILCESNRNYSDCLRIAVSELFRLLSANFSSSSFYYYCLIFKSLLLILSSSSLKALTVVNRNYSDSTSPRAVSRRGSQNGTLKINSLIKSFTKQNLPISDVYIKLSLIRVAALLRPIPPNLRAERLVGRVAYCAGFDGIGVSSLFFPRLRLQPIKSNLYKRSCNRTFYPKGVRS